MKHLLGENHPVRVLRIITRLNIGGPARHTVLLSQGLADRGFETTLMAGNLGPGEGDMSYLADEPGLTVKAISSLHREILPTRDTIALAEIISVCIRLRPHIIHTHTSKAGFLGRIAGLIAGVPIRIHTFHGHIFGGYFDEQTTRFFILLERLLAAFSHQIISLSEGQKRELSLIHRIAPANKIQVIPLGFRHLEDLASAKNRLKGTLKTALGLKPSTRLVGTVGRLVDIKGIDLLVETAARTCRIFPDVHFVIAGDGHLKSRLEKQARCLEIAHRVHFLGWQKDLSSVYADLDVFALSSHNEGTPVAVIEAMAAGVPVVATAVGGVADILEHGKLGSLVYSRNPEEIKERIAEVLSGNFPVDSERDAKIISAKTKFRFDSKRLLDDMETLYKKELKKLKPSQRL